MEFGFMIFLLSSALFGHSSGFTTPDATPYWYTTAGHYSCRYNCGYNWGACSCSSSCHYYGNCCYDYYDYCFTSTTTPGNNVVLYNRCILSKTALSPP
ncbi:hypothetical protein AMELA_G00129220 [Ameiurus melas]|uniref:SMB domain-containing protein n=1 Tax=Ameiurus melas TaxID=219545 RepID=A0A7J6ANK7_AMEME|nr:hypothetical protein AMELA_G00129220 [Ameiurus melas]